MSSGPCPCIPELKCHKHRVIVGFDPGAPQSERTVIHHSEIGHWDVDYFKNISFFPTPGTEVYHMSIDRDEVGDPNDPNWWDKLLKAIENRCNDGKKE